jgi:hypothetical protein
MVEVTRTGEGGCGGRRMARAGEEDREREAAREEDDQGR